MATESSIMDSNSFKEEYASMLSPKTREMISKREKYLGGAYRLFYRKPLNIVRGEGDYLWDDEGNKYLDMYNNVAGVAFLKKDDTESKICTFLVVEGYRGKHVASKMLECAFKYLGTTKPLITIADYKIPMFEPIIKKYNWELTQTMSEGYYNNSSRELVYNGKLPE